MNPKSKSEANLFIANPGSVSNTSREPVCGIVGVGMHTATSCTLQTANRKAAPTMFRTGICMSKLYLLNHLRLGLTTLPEETAVVRFVPCKHMFIIYFVNGICCRQCLGCIRINSLSTAQQSCSESRVLQASKSGDVLKHQTHQV